jgi:hypothetical protein
MSNHRDTATALTIEQGFGAMFEFLERYWKRGKSDEIAMLLGSMAIQSDGRPADPALWADWLTSCEKARNLKSTQKR